MNIYICETYYHLLITIVKNINNKMENDLIIFGDRLDNSLVSNNVLLSNIEKCGIFKKVYIFNYKDNFASYPNYGIKYQVNRYFFIYQLKNEVDQILSNYNDVYLFNDISTIGKCINKLNKQYILLEDGLNCFKENLNFIQKSSYLKKIIKKTLYGSTQLGESKNIKYIEVNSIKNIFINNKKIVESNKYDMLNSLSKKEKKTICQIFDNNISMEDDSIYSLLITQPLFNDGLVSSIDEQLRIFQYIVDNYFDKEKMVIKIHPREDINYSKVFPDAIILDKNFPIEIINFSNNISFSKVVTITSTSIDMIEYADKKIKLGWEWLNQVKNKVLK